ncbi:hypothetical protein FGO68_gene12671 [Halteria grandinella]|uniref:Uncharacterized protein n=1 Tax=Halteria grandinella TaxID=5974 RepID=A0A8J8NX80_HALGN|nr:hypothetical protein FGO68_gene12671 [Halteria grandinella]
MWWRQLWRGSGLGFCCERAPGWRSSLRSAELGVVAWSILMLCQCRLDPQYSSCDQCNILTLLGISSKQSIKYKLLNSDSLNVPNLFGSPTGMKSQ